MIETPPAAVEAQGASTKLRVLALIPCGIALNLVLGTIVSSLKLPVYVDAVGTIAVTLIAGLRAGVIVGVGSFLLGGILVNPVLPWFSGTQACIALFVFLVGRRGWFAISAPESKAPSAFVATLYRFRPIFLGALLGVAAGIVSAPVIVALFGGVTGSGPSVVVAFLLKSGSTVYHAVLLSGLASEPLDKTIQVLLALGLIKALPTSLKRGFGGGLLAVNRLVGR